MKSRRRRNWPPNNREASSPLGPPRPPLHEDPVQRYARAVRTETAVIPEPGQAVLVRGRPAAARDIRSHTDRPC